jgi:hypothetical protein
MGTVPALPILTWQQVNAWRCSRGPLLRSGDLGIDWPVSCAGSLLPDLHQCCMVNWHLPNTGQGMIASASVSTIPVAARHTSIKGTPFPTPRIASTHSLTIFALLTDYRLKNIFLSWSLDIYQLIGSHRSPTFFLLQVSFFELPISITVDTFLNLIQLLLTNHSQGA